MHEWLASGAALTPDHVEWHITSATLGLLASIEIAGCEYALVRRASLRLYAVEGSAYGKKLAESGWEDPFADWLGSEPGRQALVRWALWAGDVP
ncbi:MAG: hypothetical protein ACE5M4_09535 [Anaerolineales bacterium]